MQALHALAVRCVSRSAFGKRLVGEAVGGGCLCALSAAAAQRLRVQQFIHDDIADEGDVLWLEASAQHRTEATCYAPSTLATFAIKCSRTLSGYACSRTNQFDLASNQALRVRAREIAQMEQRTVDGRFPITPIRAPDVNLRQTTSSHGHVSRTKVRSTCRLRFTPPSSIHAARHLRRRTDAQEAPGPFARQTAALLPVVDDLQPVGDVLRPGGKDLSDITEGRCAIITTMCWRFEHLTASRGIELTSFRFALQRTQSRHLPARHGSAGWRCGAIDAEAAQLRAHGSCAARHSLKGGRCLQETHAVPCKRICWQTFVERRLIMLEVKCPSPTILSCKN